MSERPKEADCKSAGKRLRRFESFSRHGRPASDKFIEAENRRTGAKQQAGDFSNVNEVHAPLAQSVERFHGKEEVFGSTPEGGSACLA